MITQTHGCFASSGTATAITTAASSSYHGGAGYGGHHLDDWFRRVSTLEAEA